MCMENKLRVTEEQMEAIRDVVMRYAAADFRRYASREAAPEFTVDMAVDEIAKIVEGQADGI